MSPEIQKALLAAKWYANKQDREDITLADVGLAAKSFPEIRSLIGSITKCDESLWRKGFAFPDNWQKALLDMSELKMDDAVWSWLNSSENGSSAEVSLRDLVEKPEARLAPEDSEMFLSMFAFVRAGLCKTDCESLNRCLHHLAEGEMPAMFDSVMNGNEKARKNINRVMEKEEDYRSRIEAATQACEAEAWASMYHASMQEKARKKEADWLREHRTTEKADESRKGEPVEMEFKEMAEKIAGEEDKRLGGGLPHMKHVKEEYDALAVALKGEIVGQDDAIDQVTGALLRAELFHACRSFKGPRQILTFMGPPGVGKTMLAESLAEKLDGYVYRRFDMSDYSHKSDGKGLIGVDEFWEGGSPGVLTSHIKEHPQSVILFDEVEKAHPVVLNGLLQLLDKGQLEDHNDNEFIDFSQTIVVFTTNLGRELYGKDRKGLLPHTPGGISKGVLAGALHTFGRDEVLGTEAREEGVARLTPEFISRLSKGEFVLFRYLRPASLIDLVRRVYRSNAANMAETTGMDFPEELPEAWRMLLLLGQGRLIDARRLTVATHELIEDIAVKSVDVFDSAKAKDKQVPLTFSDIRNHPATQIMQELKKACSALLIEDEGKLIEQYKKAFPDVCFVAVDHLEDMHAALRKHDFNMALLDLHLGQPESSSNMRLALDLLNALREREPLLPVYAFSELAGERGVSDEILNHLLEAGGVREVVSKEDVGVKSGNAFHARMTGWLDNVLAEQLVQKYISGSKRIAFKPVVQMDEKGMYVSADNLREEIELGADVMGQGIVSRPHVTFDDVAGAHHAKQRLMEVVQWLQKPKKLKELGIDLPKGILLYGPPGTGKTLLAKAVAGEVGLPFIARTGSEFLGSYVGAGARHIRNAFEAAADCAPCVLFIDEIDALGKRDGAEGGGVNNTGHKEAITQLLACMDGFAAASGVFVIAATNYPKSLDAALLRPGRFDNMIEVERPNKEGRRAILDIHASGVRLDSDVDLDEVVRMTPGFSGAKLAQTIKEAGFLALRHGCNVIRQQDLLEAVNTLAMGMAKEGVKPDVEDLKRVAIHEAGHAVAGHLLEPNRKLLQLTILPRGDALGFAQHEFDESGSYLETEDELKNRMKVLLAGRAAESLMLPDMPRSTGTSDDLHRASQLAFDMLVKYGMLDGKWQGYSLQHEQLGAAGVPEGLMRDVSMLLKEVEKAVFELLGSKRKILQTFAGMLLEKETLGERDIAAILTG